MLVSKMVFRMSRRVVCKKFQIASLAWGVFNLASRCSDRAVENGVF